MQFIGIEIAPSGTHGVVLDLDTGRVIAEAYVSHRWIDGLPPGYREQEPTSWIEATDRVVRDCLCQPEVDRKRIAAFGVAGPSHGLVALDAGDCILRPAKLPGDVSSQQQAEEISRAFGGSPGLLELIGQSPTTDSAAAQCLWLKQNEPHHFQRTASLLSIQDFIAFWLTGEQATEPGSASSTGLFDIRGRCWSEEIIRFIDPALRPLLPPIGVSDQPRGLLRAELAKSWGVSELTQVGAGSSALPLSAFSVGCVADGSVALALGANRSVIGIGAEPVIDLRGEIFPLCNATGSWLGMAKSNNNCLAPEILMQHFGCSAESFEAMVQSVSPGADELQMLPDFTKEKIDHRSVLHGISSSNFTPAHLARCVVEGVALGYFEAMRHLRSIGFDPPEIRLYGSGCSSQVMRQILADALGTSVVSVSSRHGAAVGAAMQSAVAFFRQCGESLGFEEIVSYLVVMDEAGRCAPNPANRGLYEDLIARQPSLADHIL
jgi:xylulokinase